MTTNCLTYLCPVVQSNVSLTTSLSKSFVTGNFTTIYQYVLLQNVKFILRFSSWIQYFNENIFPLNMIDNENFNFMLTNNIISFEQLSPEVLLARYICCLVHN